MMGFMDIVKFVEFVEIGGTFEICAIAGNLWNLWKSWIYGFLWNSKFKKMMEIVGIYEMGGINENVTKID